MDKTLEYIQGDHNSEVFSLLGEDSGEMVKTANYDQAIAEFLSQLKRKEDKVYALINALSAGEYYGNNRNGDYFPEKALKKHHGSFTEHGHVYKHHVNKDPEKSLGKVIFSHFNDGMKRVEIVAELDKNNSDVESLIRKIHQGRPVKTSMGCKVPYDVCSCCGKKAKTRKDYCDHLRKKMGKVLEDGRKVYAINTKPRFFDISIVTIPADPTSGFMGHFGLEKNASVQSEKSAGDKSAEIEKEISTEMTDVEQDPKSLIKATQRRFTDEEIEKLSQYPINETLSTFLGLRILPHKEDFQKLALYYAGKKDLADQLEKKGEVFEVNLNTEPKIPEDLGPEYCNEKVAGEISSEISDFSLTKPHIINRLLGKTANLNDPPKKLVEEPSKVTERSYLKKLLFDDKEEPTRSAVKNPMMPMLTMGALYSGYAHLFGKSANASGFTKFMGKNPWLAPIIAGGVAHGTAQMQEEEFENSEAYSRMQKEDQRKMKDFEKEAKMFSPKWDVDRFAGNMLVATPLSYYGSMRAEEKAMRREPISNTEDFIRKHPLPVAFGSALAAGSVMRHLGKKAGDIAKKTKSTMDSFTKRAEHLNSLTPEIINQIYKELIH